MPKSLDEFRAFAEKVLIEEESKPRPSKGARTRKEQMAMEMISIYDQIEHKRRMRVLGKARAEGREIL